MQEIRIDSEIQQCTECSSPFENLFDTCYTYRTAYLALAYQLSTSLFVKRLVISTGVDNIMIMSVDIHPGVTMSG